MTSKVHRRDVLASGSAGLAALAAPFGVRAQGAAPFKIGVAISQSGPLAANGKSALLAMQIWVEDINAKGGLLGRKVELVSYDDQSNGSTVPGLYTKLLDVDKVDIAVGGYATNMLAPALPIFLQRKKVFFGLFGLAVNSKFHYDRYFSMAPNGQNPKESLAKMVLDTVMTLNPKPKTIAIVAADAEFSKNASDGAREYAKKLGLDIVYDKSYPPSTTDFAPIIRAIQATNPDCVFVGSYPLDSVGMVQAAKELDLKTRAFGGGMVGLQSTVFKTKLGPELNGVVNYDYWLPAPGIATPEATAFLAKYQARAGAAGVDPLGYYMGPYGYAYLDLVGQAVTAAGGTDDTKLATWLKATTIKTMIGPVKFGKDGEWETDRQYVAQFRGITGNGVDQFKGVDKEAVLYPANVKTADTLIPFNDARK